MKCLLAGNARLLQLFIETAARTYVLCMPVIQ